MSTAGLSLDLRARLADRVAEQLRRRGVPVATPASSQSPPKSFHEWLQEVSPSFNWNLRHSLYLQQVFEAWVRGDFRHLMISIPPRCGKSETITIRGPAYLIERDPTTRVMVAAYDDTLARLFSRRTRNLLRGRVPLSADKNAQDEWETEAGGGIRAGGIRSGFTGRGASWLFLDDLTKSRLEAESQTFRNAVYAGYTDDLRTRLEPHGDQPGKVCLIATRWHFDDILGRIQRSEDAADWHCVSIPALAEANDPLGRAIGEPLWPERYGLEEMQRMQRLMPRSFLSLYQQRPAPAEGSIFQLGWFKRFKRPPADYIRIIQSWDTSMKDAQINDPWACVTIGEAREGGFVILDVYRRHLNYPDGKRQILNLYKQWCPDLILIEDKSSGEALIQEYKHEVVEEAPGKRLPIRAVQPVGDKITRASAESDTIEAGLVSLPESADWLPEFESEILEFPLSEHADQIDALSQALSYLVNKKAKMKLGTFKVGTPTKQPPPDGVTPIELPPLPTQEELARAQTGWSWKTIQQRRR